MNEQINEYSHFYNNLKDGTHLQQIENITKKKIYMDNFKLKKIKTFESDINN